jgi:hypothetical protein
LDHADTDVKRRAPGKIGIVQVRFAGKEPGVRTCDRNDVETAYGWPDAPLSPSIRASAASVTACAVPIHHRDDFSPDYVGRGADRIHRQVRIPLSGGRLGVAQELADQGQAHSRTSSYAGKAVSKVVDADVAQASLHPQTAPGLLQVN